MSIGVDEIEPLILSRSLLLHGAEQVAGWPLGFADDIEILRDRYAVAGYELDDPFVRQRALTEPVGVASAAL